ncbi:DUF927 domain-containing protein [Paracoccus versutus]|uniref:Uncharacterized protein DUF927 n=1 Tax=Paracoccus versutus TaxID=34007 RepID=A0A3D9Y2T6_PARVE|nr:DUF927 domain-containing protein [Paracoccus versutus]REF73509.1 uncharacterized protein DUF927 [Paracoccus versutus]
MTSRNSAPEPACPVAADPENDENRGYRWSEEEHVRTDITGLPVGYLYDDQARMICLVKSHGVQPLCGPLRVAMSLTNQQENASAILIEFFNASGTRRRTVITATQLMSAPGPVAAHLAELGLMIPGSPAQLVHLLRQWVPDRHGLLAEQPGWIHAEGQIGCVTPQGRIFSGDQCTEDRPIIALGGETAVDQAGSFQGWHDGLARLARHNPLLIFAICVALAAPLLALLGLAGGGFGIFGRTSSGKTTVLHVARSVYGAPGKLMSWHASTTAFETAAHRARDGLLAIDEIPTRESTVARELTSVLYMLANGVGKKRSNVSLDDLDPRAWQTMILTTAEAPLPEIYTQSRLTIPEGLTTRLADIPATSWQHGGFAHLHEYPDPAAFADALKAECGQHHGHAGPRFIERLVAEQVRSGTGRLKTLYNAVLADILKRLSASFSQSPDGPERRVIGRFAAVSVAGQLACHWQIVPWQAQEVRTAIMEVASLWLEQRRALMPPPQTEISERLMTYFKEHQDSFADVDSGETFSVHAHAGWHDAERLVISSEVFAQIVRPLLPRTAARQLHQLGILIAGGEARSLQQRRSPRIDPSRGREYWLSKAGLARNSPTI